MVVRIRLARHGTRNNPFYHIVAIHDAKPRDARPIEKLGEYDPIPRPRIAIASSSSSSSSKLSSSSSTYASSATSLLAAGAGAISSSLPSAPSSNAVSTATTSPALPLRRADGLYTSGAHRDESSVPLEKRVEWNANRIRHWLERGAQPSKPVARLLDRAGLIPPGKHYKGIYRPPPGSPLHVPNPDSTTTTTTPPPTTPTSSAAPSAAADALPRPPLAQRRAGAGPGAGSASPTSPGAPRRAPNAPPPRASRR